MSTTYNFVCVPNGADGPETAFRNLSRAGSLAGNPPGDLSRLEVPTFLVGTLDSLMTLSDELGRVDQGIEAAVKKVERAYSDLAGAGASLSVAGQSPQAYVQQFAWDYAKFPHRRSLRDLVALVGGGVAAIDDEMRALSMALAEKAAALNDLKRKKGGSMLVGDLADSLGDGVVSQIQLLDTEYLKTVFCAVAKSGAEAFERTYASIGSDLVSYDGIPGSPVVPGSLKFVKEDFESRLYTITILKSRYEKGGFEGSEFKAGTQIDLEEQFAKQAREKRVVVKPYVANPGQAGRSAMVLEENIAAVDGMTANMTRWCKTHYGECFAAWVHLKLIRVFVESVLRYGLPVNSTTAVFKAAAGKEVALDKALGAQFKHLGDQTEGEEPEEAGGEEYLPHVSQKMTVDV